MKFIGSKDFYIKTIKIAVPMMVQHGITNFVGMLDNIMVGRIGTDAMSGVSIVNQLMFVFSLCIFGGVAGIGIFTAQFAGKGDTDGIRYTMRMKLMLAGIITVFSTLLFIFKGDTLIGLWLKGEGGSGSIAATLSEARTYLIFMLIGLLPFAISFAYASTLRETGETVVPMKASVAAVILNLAGNYILIYGKFGAPALGVAGAALATVISRFVEAGILIFWTHLHASKNPFAVGLFRHFYVPKALLGRVALRSSPVLLNEALWSGGQTLLSQQYSLLGLDVVAAMNISGTVNNLFNIAMIAMGDSIAIILGQELGKGIRDRDELLGDAYKLSFFSVIICAVFGGMLFAVSGIFPQIYNTSDTIKHLATGLIRIGAIFMMVYAYENSTYFTLRSGGKTWITFAFDSLFVWVISIPFLAFMVRHSGLPLIPLFVAVQCLEFIKCAVGFVLVKKGVWINDLTKLT